MWYSSGTVSATNNSSVITGTGTAFLANVRIGDGITIQGSQSLHEVIGIASNTQMTIKPAFTGTTGSGKQFACAPILGYDKDLSDAFNQLRLQFGDQLSNLQPWAYAATLDAAQTAFGMSASGKTVATGTPAQGRAALGLGSAATRDVTQSSHDTTAGRLLKVGDFSIGKVGEAATLPVSDLNDLQVNGIFSAKLGTANWPLANSGGVVQQFMHSPNQYITQIAYSSISDSISTRTKINATTWTSWKDLIHTGNTTVDSNGFIKNASPILKLHSDRVETEAPAVFERIDTGLYRLIGCNGLRLDDGWYIETPHDRNGNKYFNVEWYQDVVPSTEKGVLDAPADVALSIHCYERVWNPSTGAWDNGEPVDIPDGRWIDLRMNEVRQPEPEIDDDTEATP